ncbi:MAG TPA: disulfide reductase [Syntrophobacteraceae bacterium]|nr:disulfide reductase [Syntrophobacteraceae bacterium]HBD07422.1 disulfide reductase [Syntrophobacteraceae bacterium]HBZ53858.1 disulfide reductase [Syntrophobacteraceae bacterium]
MKVTYYPGCSLEGTARDYADSIHELCGFLGIELEEIPDWNCCGASAAHSINHQASVELAGRNLREAGKLASRDILVPCPMCFNRLKTAAKTLQDKDHKSFRIELGANLPRIWDLANFMANEPILEQITAKVQTPLKGLRVVCYYGCMASRPPKMTDATDCENPQSLDRLMKALGATVLAWPYKTDCCGASLALSRPDMVHQLVGKLYDMAVRVGAQAMVVSCQMCHANLDLYQDKIENVWGRKFGLPILYFSELVGLTCRLPGVKANLRRHFVDPFPVLRELKLVA